MVKDEAAHQATFASRYTYDPCYHTHSRNASSCTRQSKITALGGAKLQHTGSGWADFGILSRAPTRCANMQRPGDSGRVIAQSHPVFLEH